MPPTGYSTRNNGTGPVLTREPRDTERVPDCWNLVANNESKNSIEVLEPFNYWIK